MIKKLIRKLFIWIFEEELNELYDNLNYIKEVVGDKEARCSVDMHVNSSSWCVICLNGKTTTYIKFMKLTDKNCMQIMEFLKRFKEVDIDYTPNTSPFIKTTLYDHFL